MSILTVQDDRLEVNVYRYSADSLIRKMAGRTGVEVAIYEYGSDPEDSYSSSVDLTIEAAIRLARELMLSATRAMYSDPGPWKFSRTDIDMLCALRQACKSDRKNGDERLEFDYTEVKAAVRADEEVSK